MLKARVMVMVKIGVRLRARLRAGFACACMHMHDGLAYTPRHMCLHTCMHVYDAGVSCSRGGSTARVQSS